jgi:hypothetical protein
MLMRGLSVVCLAHLSGRILAGWAAALQPERRLIFGSNLDGVRVR